MKTAISLGAVALAVLTLSAGFAAAAGFTYTDAAAGNYMSAATWTSTPAGGTFPQTVDDIANITTNTVSLGVATSAVTYVSGTGKLVASGYNTAQVDELHMNGGTLDISYTGFNVISGSPVMYFDAPSTVQAFGEYGNGSIGRPYNPDTSAPAIPTTFRGTSTMIVDGGGGTTNPAAINITYSAASTWTGSYKVINSGTCNLQTSATGLGHDIELAGAGSTFNLPYFGGSEIPSGDRSYTKTLSGIGTLLNRYETYGTRLSFDTGAKVAPGAAGTHSVGTLTIKGFDNLDFNAGSTLAIDVVDTAGVITADKLVRASSYDYSMRTTINTGANLVVDLPTPTASTTLNVDVFTTPYSLFTPGTFTPTWNNSAGWSDLTVNYDTTTAGAERIWLTGTFTAATGTPALTASPLSGTAVDFGKLHPLTGTMGAVTNPGPVNLSNTGDAGSTLSITAAVTGTNASLFHVSNPALPKVLTGGAGAQPFDLLFDGGAPGVYTATVTFNGDNGQSASYPVSATVLYQGDANEDGKVSFADYIALANNFGQTGAAWTMGDFNGDGKVSFADYILLANNFGQHVPEPATLGLLLIGGLGLIRRNRK